MISAPQKALTGHWLRVPARRYPFPATFPAPLQPLPQRTADPQSPRSRSTWRRTSLELHSVPPPPGSTRIAQSGASTPLAQHLGGTAELPASSSPLPPPLLLRALASSLRAISEFPRLEMSPLGLEESLPLLHPSCLSTTSLFQPL